MKIRGKNITFHSDKTEFDLPRPAAASRFIPDWFRTMPGVKDRIETVKKCIPVLDGLVSGYAITLPHDIYVSRSESGELKLSWNLPDGVEDFVAERPVELGAKMPRPAGHYPNHMVWKGVWGVKTPRNWSLLSSTPWQVYIVAIGLGLFGITIAYIFTRLIKLHPANARTIALETGIQNGPLAIAIITVTFANDPNIGQIMLVPAMYSLFIVIISTIVTFWFRRANLAAEQKIPNLL